MSRRKRQKTGMINKEKENNRRFKKFNVSGTKNFIKFI